MSIRIKIILIIVVLLVTILLVAFIIVPSLNASINKSASIEKEKENNRTLNERLSNLLSIREKYHLLNAEYQKYSLQIPSENDISIFTNEIYDIANYSNIEIYSIDYSEGVVSDQEEEMGLVIIEANLIINGSYYNILNFINTLEKIPRIAKIERLVIQSSQDKYENLSANIKIEMYYKK